MKKFIMTVLCISVFFIGLGSLVEKTTANFKSDAQALDLIRKARIAIGGDANINAVKSMTISAETTNFFEKNNIVQSEQGNLEIALEMPGRFSKMLKIGNPDTTSGGNTEIRKEVNVIVMKSGDGVNGFDPKATGDNKNVFVIKSDGGENVEDVKVMDDNKIIIKKSDGTTETVNSDGKNKIVIKRNGGGDNATWNTEDGKKIVIDKDVRVAKVGEMRQNEMLRTTLALLLTAPEGIDVGYFYKGESIVDGFSVNIVEVQTGGSSFKLYLDKSSNLPKMISFMGMNFPQLLKFDKPVGDFPQKVIMESGDFGGTVEHQIKFSDYRSIGGLLLPFTWTETVGGKPSQNVNVANYEINPPNIADKFKDTKVFVRTQKPQ